MLVAVHYTLHFFLCPCSHGVSIFTQHFCFLFVVVCCLDVVCSCLRFISYFLVVTLFSLLCVVFLVRTNHDYFCPVCKVLFSLDFLAPVLVFVADSLVESFAISCVFLFWFSLSLEGVGTFRLLRVFSISISSMRSFNSSTLGDSYGVP